MRSYRVLKPFAKRGEPLAPLTTMRVGGPADLLARPTSIRQLSEVLRVAAEEGHPVRILGGGSNILVDDEGVRGVVIQLRAGLFRRVTFHRTSEVVRAICPDECDGRHGPTARVYAAAGANLPRLVHEACRRGLGGLVQLAGVPGTVGGALRGNAGTRYGDIGDYVRWVEVLDADGGPHNGETIRLTRREAGFRYRGSDLDGRVVLGCELELPRGNADDLLQEMRAINREKSKAQPLAMRSAGCIFKNPPNDSAGRLIDAMGFKGRRRGQAAVSERHANFILNRGAAHSRDVLGLTEEIRRAAHERHGVKLHYEIKIWRSAA